MDYRVRLKGSDRKWMPYQHVRASSPKEAAEKLYGGPLREEGSNYHMGAMVRIRISGTEHISHFFET
jgi:hypothetical protein